MDSDLDRSIDRMGFMIIVVVNMLFIERNKLSEVMLGIDNIHNLQITSYGSKAPSFFSIYVCWWYMWMVLSLPQTESSPKTWSRQEPSCFPKTHSTQNPHIIQSISSNPSIYPSIDPSIHPSTLSELLEFNRNGRIQHHQSILMSWQFQHPFHNI